MALKGRELAEFFETGVDFGTGEGAETLHTEFFTAKAPHDRAVNYRPTQIAALDVAGFEIEALAGQIADESTGETIARTGAIEDRIEQIAGDDEVGIAAE